MNSALKPVMSGAAVTAGGQASPAKGNVATVNHAPVGLPQGANSLHHNNLVGQNLSQPSAPAPLPHAAPSMAPVSANMAQMAQNMSHHGNLSHLNQNSAPPPPAASPAKTGSPLSLVQDKVTASQPLALTRTPEKKEPESSNTKGHSNGSIDSPKSGASAPTSLKPQNPEPNKEKLDIAKTSPSTPKPPEKPANVPTTPQKPEGASGAGQAEGAAQPKVATANEPPEKSPSKPGEPIPAPTADVAPSQSDNKPLPESANNQSSSQLLNQSSSQPASQSSSQLSSQASQAEKAPTPVKQDPPETAKTEPVPEKKEPERAEKPVEEKKEEPKEKEKVEPKKDAPPTPAAEKPQEKETKKVETRPKSTLKLATVTPPIRKRRQTSPAKDGPSPPKKLAEGESTPTSESRTKRNRTKVQLYQSPTPELTMATKLSASAGRATPTKPNDDKLIVFYKNEYLAVRNAEGGFYVCQAMQNVYRSTRKIKIRWLSQDKAGDPSGETYKPDFYDVTDMECVLTTLSLSRSGGGGQVLRPAEKARATSILQRALKAEKAGDRDLEVTAEHPDGLDLSLYTDESQLDKKTKRNSSKSSPRNKHDSSTDVEKEPSPKKARPAKGSPKKGKGKAKAAKRSKGSAPPSKTATAVSEKSTPARGKRTPAKKETPTATPTPTRGRRAVKESKPSPLVATPSTSTGKTTRTPRKPPARK